LLVENKKKEGDGFGSKSGLQNMLGDKSPRLTEREMQREDEAPGERRIAGP